MATMNVSLPDAMRAWVDAQVESGQYGNVSEYVRDLIRRDQKARAQDRLEQMLLEGINSGAAEPVTEEFWTELRRRAVERAEGRRDQEAS